jgi:tRNA modification GTPase
MVSASTIFALASGRPPAAIAIIRISGPAAHAAGVALAGDLPPPREAAVRTLRTQNGDILDEAILLRFDAPASATGEDTVELHCHGGRAVVDAVLSALRQVGGLREAQPGEFTRRAFENGRIDLTEAEGLADLLEAETESQRRAALGLAKGGLRREVERWQQAVLALSARAEAAIDYVEEEGVEVDASLADDCRALSDELGRWLDRPRSEPLREGIKVVIAGPPNVGKSSLLNAIAGLEKAIVTDRPGTTRDQIEVPLSIDGVPFLFVDTAGLRDSPDELERIGIDRARFAADQADILWWLGDPGEAPQHGRMLLVHSRCDLPERSGAPVSSLCVSARTGEGIGGLLQETKVQALEILPAEGDVALNRRQAQLLTIAYEALSRAVHHDLVIFAEEVRTARSAFDQLTGRAGVEDLLDQLFGRFCLGK